MRFFAIKKDPQSWEPLLSLVRLAGIEPATLGFGVRNSREYAILCDSRRYAVCRNPIKPLNFWRTRNY